MKKFILTNTIILLISVTLGTGIFFLNIKIKPKKGGDIMPLQTDRLSAQCTEIHCLWKSAR